ncbi:MAG: MFS transporter [Nocardioides sp.]|uniref:MFS transporter n=1 Tax=Nocardioides sp. TaxID=35761 RepID=UPI0039E62806
MREPDGGVPTAIRRQSHLTRGLVALTLVTASYVSGLCLLLAVAPLWVAGAHGAVGSGLVTGVLMLTTVVAAALAPAVVRRISSRRALELGLLLMAVPSPLFVVSDSLAWVLPLSGARGLGLGLSAVVGSAALARVAPPGGLARSAGFYSLSITVPNLIFVPLGMVLVESFGYGVAFAMGSAALVGLLFTPRLGIDQDPNPVRASGVPAFGPVALVRTDRRLRAATVLVFAAGLCAGWLPTFVGSFAVSAAVASAGLGVWGVGNALGRWGVGRLARSEGSARLTAMAIGCTLVGLVLGALVFAPAGSVPLQYVSIAAVAAGFGALQTLTLLGALLVADPARRQVASAAWNVGLDGGVGLGAIAVGVIAHALSFRAGSAVAAAVLLLLGLTQVRRRSDA